MSTDLKREVKTDPLLVELQKRIAGLKNPTADGYSYGDPRSMEVFLECSVFPRLSGYSALALADALDAYDLEEAAQVEKLFLEALRQFLKAVLPGVSPNPAVVSAATRFVLRDVKTYDYWPVLSEYFATRGSPMLARYFLRGRTRWY
jgi:hypothetical protein